MRAAVSRRHGPGVSTNRAPGGAVGRQRQRAAVPLGDVPGDREAQPGAAVAGRAGVVEPGEPLEDRSRSAGGTPGPVVGDGERRPSRRRSPRVTAIAVPRMPDGVVEQVADRPRQLRRVAGAPGPGARRATSIRGAAAAPARGQPPDHRRRGRPAPRAADPAPRRRPGRAAAGRRPAAAASTVSPEHAGVRWRPGRPISGCARSTSSSARIRASGLRSSWAASATNRRCRSADAGQPVEHRVHRARQPGDLVRASAAPAPAGRAGWPRSGRPRRGWPRPAAAPGRPPPDQPGEDGGAQRARPTSSDRSRARRAAPRRPRGVPATSTVSPPTGVASTRASVPSFGMLAVGDRRPPRASGQTRRPAGRGEAATHRPVGADHLDDDVVGRQVGGVDRPPGAQPRRRPRRPGRPRLSSRLLGEDRRGGRAPGRRRRRVSTASTARAASAVTRKRRLPVAPAGGRVTGPRGGSRCRARSRCGARPAGSSSLRRSRAT